MWQMTYNYDPAGDELYYPWGQQWKYDNEINSWWQFYGNISRFQVDLGLYLTSHRFYSPDFARWLSPDPLGGNIMNPQSFNRYAYALNSPATFNDPLGLDATGCRPTHGRLKCSNPDTKTVTAVAPDIAYYESLSDYRWYCSLWGQWSLYGSSFGSRPGGPGGGGASAPPFNRITWAQLQKLVAANNLERKDNICDDLIDCIVFKESTYHGGFNTNAVPLNKQGRPIPGATARGLMQVTRGATVDLHRLYQASFPANTYDQLFNPSKNIQAGSVYLRTLVGRFGSLSTALAHYGTGKVYGDDVLNCEKQLQMGSFPQAEAAAHAH